MITDLEHLSSEERLRESWLFNMEKRRLCQDLIVVSQYLKWAYKKEEESLFAMVVVKEQGAIFLNCRVRLDIRRKFFMMRLVRHLNRLPKEIVDATSLAVLKVRLDGVKDVLARSKGLD